MDLDNFKLKHIEAVQSGSVDYVRLLIEVLGYKDTWWNRKTKLVGMMKEMAAIVRHIQNLNPKELRHDPEGSPIKYSNVDNMPFIARMELDALLEGSREENILRDMANVIAIATYQENIGGDFDIDSKWYSQYRRRIEQMPAIRMIGLHNTIQEDLETSQKTWDARFRAIEVEDKDYNMAGGSRMQQFNVINTIRKICKDLNIPYTEAWQVSYVVVQSIAYADATHTHIQYTMTKLKEAHMRAQRKKLN